MNASTLEFLLKLKDMASGGLAKFAQNAKQSFAKSESYLDSFNRKVSNTASSLQNLGSKMKSFFSSSGGSFLKGGILGTALAGIVSTAAIANFAREGIGKAIQMEATKKTFQVLTGSREGGNQLANGLNSLQANTVLGPEVFKNAQTLLGFGLASERVIPTLKMLGDVSMGNAEKLGSLTLAFAQVQSAGKLTGQDLLQFVNAGFNPLNEISRTTGRSMAYLRKQMEEGGISALMVSKAFETATGKGGKFENMMQQMAETTQGKIAQMEGAIEQRMTDLGDSFKWVSEVATDLKFRFIDLIAPSNTLQASVINEKSGLDTLVGAITGINTSNAVRSNLITELKNKYPEFYGWLDAEKTKNGEILAGLTDINLAYERRLDLAMKQDDVTRLTALKKETMDKAGIYAKLNDKLQKGGGTPDYEGLALYKWKEEGLAKKLAQATVARDSADMQNRFESLRSLSGNTVAMKSTFAGRDKDELAFMKMLEQWRTYGFNGTAADLKRAEQLRNGSAAFIPESTKTTVSSKTSETGNRGVANSITSGGPRTINISFKNMIENLHVEGSTTDLSAFEQEMKKVMLRVLNSGAAIQD